MNLTIPEKILVAAFEKWPDSGTVFSEADLAVVAWKKFPETFGLRGYADCYPDSKHILSNIMGQKGLRGKRWISQLGDTRYTLTPGGRDHAGTLLSEHYSTGEQVKNSVSSEHVRILRRLFGGQAYNLWVDGSRDDLIFRDACEFWNITPASTGEQLDDRLRSIDTVFALVDTLLSDGRIVNIGSRSIATSDVELCQALNKYLQAIFQDDLSYIKSREVKRGVKRVKSV